MLHLCQVFAKSEKAVSNPLSELTWNDPMINVSSNKHICNNAHSNAVLQWIVLLPSNAMDMVSGGGGQSEYDYEKVYTLEVKFC